MCMNNLYVYIYISTYVDTLVCTCLIYMCVHVFIHIVSCMIERNHLYVNICSNLTRRSFGRRIIQQARTTRTRFTTYHHMRVNVNKASDRT